MVKIERSSIEHIRSHIHVNDPTTKEVKKAKHLIKEIASSSPGLAPQEVASTVLSALDVEVVAQMPLVRSIQRQVRGVRQGNVPSMNFHHVNDVSFPEEMYFLGDNENILKSTIRDQDLVAFIFSRNALIEKFQMASEIYADGTFSVCPRLFAQIYTIHANVSGLIVPVFYVLMSNRTEESYKKVLTQNLTICSNRNQISKIVTDFERGAINAMKSLFPTARTQGCYFHFNQVCYIISC